MEKTRIDKRPPYLRGSVPEALAILVPVLTFVMLSTSMLTMSEGIEEISHGRVTEGIILCMLSYVPVPMIIASIGALKLARGRASGAAVISGALRARKALMVLGIIGAVLYGLQLQITAMSNCSKYASWGFDRTPYFIGEILGILAAMVPVIMLMIFRVKLNGDMRDLMIHARWTMDPVGARLAVDPVSRRVTDLRGERAARPLPRLRAWVPVFLAVVCCLALAVINVLFVAFYLTYSPRWMPGFLFYGTIDYIFIGAAVCLLIASLYRGGRRSCVTAEGETTFRPARYMRVSPLSIAGTVMLSRIAFDLLMNTAERVIAFAGYGSFTVYIIPNLVSVFIRFVMCVLLAAALLSRRRALLTVIAAAMGILAYVTVLVFDFIRIPYRMQSRPLEICSYVLLTAFMVLLLVSAVISLRRRRRAGKGLRVAALVVGLTAVVSLEALSLSLLGFFLTSLTSVMTDLLFTGLAVAALCLAKYPAELAPEAKYPSELAPEAEYPAEQAPEAEHAEEEPGKSAFTEPAGAPEADPVPDPDPRPESPLDRARRESLKPIRLHKVKDAAIQVGLALAEAGHTCTVERIARRDKDDRFLVRSGDIVLGELRADEYSEGQIVVLASLDTEDDGIIRPSVYVI